MPARQLIKNAALRALPDAALRLFSARSRRITERHAKLHGLDALARQVSQLGDGRVLSGPFKGMRLDYSALPVHSAPKLLGTFEMELAPFVEDIVAAAPRSILNVGTSDGYYCVGLAMRLPQATIYAAEADRKSVRATLRNAALNGASDRVVPVGIVHSGRLGDLLSQPGSAVVMDCEGAEFQLLDPGKDPALQTARILVELHADAGDPDVLRRRFTPTHRIETVIARPRVAADMPDRARVLPIAALDELREPAQVWMYMVPRP